MPSALKKLQASKRDMPNVDETEKAEENGKAAESDSDFEEVNVFKVEILDSKRERKELPEKAMFEGWFSKHIIEKEGVTVSVSQCYDAYIEACQEANKSAVDNNGFIKHIKNTYPTGFTIKEDSPHAKTIKEKKKSTGPKKPTGSLHKTGMKMKDILKQAFEDLGNPKKGLRFHTLRGHVAMRYPVLRVDLRPNFLMSAIQRGVVTGYIWNLRGVGKSGMYRWELTKEQEEAEEAEEKAEQQKLKDERLKKKKEKLGLSDDADDAEKKEGEEGEKAEKKDEEKKDEEGDEKEGEKKEGEEDEKPKKKRKKHAESSQKKAKKRARISKRIVHSDPQTVTECFQMAITYMADPKVASTGAIKQYISDYYPHIDVDKRVPSALERGIEKGYWRQYTGRIPQGTFELTVAEFDPARDNDLEDLIINAIVANNSMKVASAQYIKDYIIEYHANFKLEDNPFRFKKALQKGEDIGIFRRLSGIGCSGSFELVGGFVPSPAALAGQDTPSDYESDTEDEQYDDEVDYDKYDAPVPYVPHRNPRKRGREIKTVARFDNSHLPRQLAKSKYVKGKRKAAKSAGQGKKKYAESSSEEEESSSDEEEAPVSKKGRQKRAAKKHVKTGARSSKRTPSKSRKSYADANSDEESSEEEAPPQKSDKKPKGAKKPAKSTKAAPPKEPSSSEESAAEEASDDDEPPKKSRKKKAIERKAKGRSSSRGSRGASSGKSYLEDDSDDQSDSDFDVKKEKKSSSPKKSSPKKTPIKADKKKGKKKR